MDWVHDSLTKRPEAAAVYEADNSLGKRSEIVDMCDRRKTNNSQGQRLDTVDVYHRIKVNSSLGETSGGSGCV